MNISGLAPIMYYEVGTAPTVKFTNRFMAAHHAGTHNLNMRFNMYDSVFDHSDWSREPDLTWDQLLDIRAQQIAAKNKPIVLYFSGGTDSYTIYKVFERNNIFLFVCLKLKFLRKIIIKKLSDVVWILKYAQNYDRLI